MYEGISNDYGGFISTSLKVVFFLFQGPTYFMSFTSCILCFPKSHLESPMNQKGLFLT